MRAWSFWLVSKVSAMSFFFPPSSYFDLVMVLPQFCPICPHLWHPSIIGSQSSMSGLRNRVEGTNEIRTESIYMNKLVLWSKHTGCLCVVTSVTGKESEPEGERGVLCRKRGPWYKAAFTLRGGNFLSSVSTARLPLTVSHLVHISVWCHVVFQTLCLHESYKHMRISEGKCVNRDSTEPSLGKGILSHLDKHNLRKDPVLASQAQLGGLSLNPHSIKQAAPTPIISPNAFIAGTAQVGGFSNCTPRGSPVMTTCSASEPRSSLWDSSGRDRCSGRPCSSFLGGNSNLLLLIPPNTLSSFHILCSTSLLTWISHLMNHFWNN